MPTVNLSPIFNGYQGFTPGGLPLAGGFINTYLAGTTTPAATYTSISGSIANSNPIQLDASGRPPNEIWLIAGQAYNFVLTDSLGLNPLSYDNISGVGDNSNLIATTGAGLVGYDGTLSYAAATLGEFANDLPSFMTFIPASQRAAIRARTSTFDCTSALTNALAFTGGRIRVPAGRYRFNGNATGTWSGSPVLIDGDGGVYAVDTGTEFEFYGSGAGITYNGATTNTNFRMRGIKLISRNAAAQTFGLKLNSFYMASLDDVAFEGFSFQSGTVASAGLYCTGAASGQSLITRLSRCQFSLNYNGIYYDKSDSNVLSVQQSWFFGNNGAGVRGGDYLGNAFSFMQWDFGGGTVFEGNVLGDVQISAGARGLNVKNCYFETALTRAPIQIATNGGSPISNAVSVEGNTFQGQPAASGGFVEVSNVDGIVVRNNFAAVAPTANRYWLKNTNAGGTFTNVYVDQGSTVSGGVKATAVFDGTNASTGQVYDSSGLAVAWTPGIAFGGASVGLTYSLQSATYIRRGNLITCQFRIVMTAVGSSTGLATLTGLPFTSTNTQDEFGAGGRAVNYSGMSSVTGGIDVVGALNATVFNLTTPAATTSVFLNNGNFTGSSSLNGTFSYQAAS